MRLTPKRTATAKLGGHVLPSELAEALKADVVILAVPFSVTEDVLRKKSIGQAG
ncbi:hypothetical protein GR212_18470 [Rhizobium lusitanum]|uniref:Pyrroline-5-carboxylate reductase catalytic N-terminal domain-containing protein n=1 Tax=Rhizobium lusitanum TaxID=293958 RepID=A0A6L9U885_9HYPH|nr:hypothetical protein [Rhizobium lusitanum]